MAGNVGQLWIEMGADVARLRKDMAEAKTIVGTFKSEAESAFKGIQAAALSYLSFQGLTQLFKATVTAAAEEEQSLLRLDAVLRAHGITNKDVVRVYNDMANEMQMTTRYTDDQVRAAQEMLLTYNVLPSQIEKIIKTAANLGVRTGDLSSATQALGQAYNGNTKQLKQYFPEIKRAIDAGMTFEQVLKELNNRYGNMAQREMEGYSGEVNRLQKEWKEFGETVGGPVASALAGVLKILNDIADNGISKSIGNFLLQDIEGEDPAVRASKKKSRDALNGTGKTDWETWSKIWKDENTLLMADLVATRNIIEKTDKQIKSASMSATELRDLWIKAQAEEYAAAEEFNEKYLADQKKLQDDLDAEIDRQNKATAEQQVVDLANYYAEKEKKIKELGQLELDQINLQREATYQMFSDIISMANSAGKYGEGVGKMATSLEGFTSAYTGEDEYKDKLALAEKYYNDLNDMADKSAGDIARTNEAYDNMMLMRKQASFSRTTRMTSNMFGMMAGAALQYYKSTGEQDKKAFAVYKAIMVAETIISTISATQKAYETGMRVTGSLGGGVGFAAVAAAAGAARIAQILSTDSGTTSYTPASGVTAASISGTSATTSEVEDKTRSQNINIYVYGSVVDHQKFARQIVTELNQAESDGVH